MKKNTASYKDCFMQITEYVIEQLDKGKIIWKQGWNPLAMPSNLKTRRRYRGWNLFFLNFIMQLKAYKSPYFLTFLQAKNMGGRIKQGEKGYLVTYWLRIDSKSSSISPEEDESEETAKQSTRRVPRTFVVFNLDQTEGIDYPQATVTDRPNGNKIEACEELIAQYKDAPEVTHGGDKAYYVPVLDFIRMPNPEQFTQLEEYYGTKFHEFVHSTGHPKRLNRDELNNGSWADENYSFEELIAEFGACFLCGMAGISTTTIDNSAAYIRGWRKKLSSDKSIIYRAASKAQAAVDYILGVHQPDREPIPQPEEAVGVA